MISRNAPFLMPDGKTVSREWASYLFSLAQSGDYVVSFNGRKGTVRLAGSDVTGALGYVPVTSDSPVLTGNPTAPTPGLGDDSKSLSTTEFVQGTVNGVATVNVSGNGNVTLTATQAGAGILVFTGTLTADISVFVPATSKSWIVSNQAAGDYTLAVKTSSGSGITVTQGTNIQLWCDGTNVLLGNPIVTLGAWETPTLLNGWSNFDTSQYTPASYCIDSLGIVRIRGLVTSGTVGDTTPIFTLPDGFTPPYRHIFSVVSNDALGRVDVDASGNVFVHIGNNAYVSLDGINFRNA